MFVRHTYMCFIFFCTKRNNGFSMLPLIVVFREQLNECKGEGFSNEIVFKLSVRQMTR